MQPSGNHAHGLTAESNSVITVEQHAQASLRKAHHLMTSHGFAGAGAAAGAPFGGKSS